MVRSKTLVIRLTEDEITQLEQQAHKMGLPISEYARQKLVGSSSGDQLKHLFEETLKLIEELPAESEFTLRQLHGVSWNQIPNSIRLLLGKYFNKQFENGNIHNVEKTDRKWSNAVLYKKIKKENEKHVPFS